MIVLRTLRAVGIDRCRTGENGDDNITTFPQEHGRFVLAGNSRASVLAPEVGKIWLTRNFF